MNIAFNGMNLIEEIKESWGWIGIEPEEIVAANDFGHLVIRDAHGHYWRLIPEECSCMVVARNRMELDTLFTDQEFLQNWYMRPLVDLARQKLGQIPEGHRYCLKIPAVLGGQYSDENLATAPLVELIRFSGDLSRQIDGLSDGTQIEIEGVD